jgi:hypothetical protein
VKKAARKVKQPVAPVVESIAVEVIEQPAPGVITVTRCDVQGLVAHEIELLAHQVGQRLSDFLRTRVATQSWRSDPPTHRGNGDGIVEVDDGILIKKIFHRDVASAIYGIEHNHHRTRIVARRLIDRVRDPVMMAA